MPTPPQFQTAEFLALQAEWYARAAEGPESFDDIERPPPCRDSADPTLPARHAHRYRDYLRPDNPAGRNVPLEDLLAAEDGEAPPLLTADATPLWVSPVDYLREALNHYKFKNRKDRAIVRRLHEGETWLQIAKRLHVGEHRIQRVIRDVRAWRRGA